MQVPKNQQKMNQLKKKHQAYLKIINLILIVMILKISHLPILKL